MPVVSEPLADYIRARDGWRCRYCHGPVRPARIGGPITDDTATIDHLVPRDAGGGNEPLNLLTSCWRCNRRKDSTIPTADRIRHEHKLSMWLDAQMHRDRRRMIG